MDNRITRRRLKAAFQELEKDGILCRGNFACCTTCATHELGEIVDKEENALGGIYWNMQDEEDFRKSGRVMIGFFSKKDDPVLYEQVARRAVRAFENAGLGVFWEETAARKIEVFPKDQKPSVGIKPVSPMAKEIIRRTGIPIGKAEELLKGLTKEQAEELIRKLKEKKK